MLRVSRLSVSLFGRTGFSRFRNIVAPISSPHLLNSVGQRENEQRWYSVKPGLKRLLYGDEHVSTKAQDYEFFINSYGKYMKLGEDCENHRLVAPVLRFFSSQSDEGMINLDEYVDNMLPEQADIFYINAADGVINVTPFLQKLLDKNIEVLFLVDPIDDVAIQNLKSYKGKNFVDASKEESCMDLGGEEVEKEKEILNQEFGQTLDLIKKRLGNEFDGVQISTKRRPGRPPCVVVTGRPFDWLINMKRLVYKSETVGFEELMKKIKSDLMTKLKSRRVLEINPQHPIIRRLHDALKNDPEDEHALKVVDVLHCSAVCALCFGYTTKPPADYERDLKDDVSYMMSLVLDDNEYNKLVLDDNEYNKA